MGRRAYALKALGMMVQLHQVMLEVFNQHVILKYIDGGGEYGRQLSV